MRVIATGVIIALLFGIAMNLVEIRKTLQRLEQGPDAAERCPVQAVVPDSRSEAGQPRSTGGEAPHSRLAPRGGNNSSTTGVV